MFAKKKKQNTPLLFLDHCTTEKKKKVLNFLNSQVEGFMVENNARKKTEKQTSTAILCTRSTILFSFSESEILICTSGNSHIVVSESPSSLPVH